MTNVKVILGLAVIERDQVCLCKYAAGHDQQTGWFLPDLIVEPYEDIEARARQTVEQLFAPRHLALKLAAVDSFRGNDQSWHIAIFYKATIEEHAAMPPNGTFVALSQLPGRADFAHHGWTYDMLQRCLG